MAAPFTACPYNIYYMLIYAALEKRKKSPKLIKYKLKMSVAIESEKILIEKLQDLKVSKKDIKCNKCSNVDIKLVKRKIYSWRCENKKCQCYCSLKKDSNFELHNKKPLDLIIQLIKFWCLCIPIIKAFELIKLEKKDDERNQTASLPIIGSIYQEMRSLCSKSMLDKKAKLG